MPRRTWNLRRFMWAPALGLRGILRLTPFKDVFIASGSAVGGGSVVYACTLYRGARSSSSTRNGPASRTGPPR